jgi:hypothetical protein
MKRLTIIVMLLAAAMCASAQTKKKSDKATTAPQALTVPKDAVNNGNGTYSYTDKQGKKWIYVVTPFGVVRNSAPEPESGSKAASGNTTSGNTGGAIKATDKGDTVQFERASPFGKSTWEKKKSELTEDERRILDAQDANQTAKPDAK